MSAIIRQIEGAMIQRLKLANTVPNFGALIKTVDRYSGDFNDENVARLIEKAPFTLLSHTRSTVLSNTSTGSQWEGTFVIVCGSTTLRTDTMTSRIGGPAAIELGSRQIAELVRDLLTGQSLGLPIRALQPESIDEVYSGAPGGASGQHWLSVTGIQFTTTYSTTRSTIADGGDIAGLVAMHAIWSPVTPDDMAVGSVPDNEFPLNGGV